MMNDMLASAVDLSGLLDTSAEQKAKQLPDPKTYHILCVVPEAMEEFADSEVGIVKANQTLQYALPQPEYDLLSQPLQSVVSEL